MVQEGMMEELGLQEVQEVEVVDPMEKMEKMEEILIQEVGGQHLVPEVQEEMEMVEIEMVLQVHFFKEV